MKLTVFKRRPYSAIVYLSQDEAWKLIRGLVCQMQTNDTNREREEFIDAGGQYFSISVEPDPVRFFTGRDRASLENGFNSLLMLLSEKAQGPKYERFAKGWAENIAPELKKTLDKLFRLMQWPEMKSKKEKRNVN